MLNSSTLERRCSPTGRRARTDLTDAANVERRACYPDEVTPGFSLRPRLPTDVNLDVRRTSVLAPGAQPSACFPRTSSSYSCSFSSCSAPLPRGSTSVRSIVVQRPYASRRERSSRESDRRGSRRVRRRFSGVPRTSRAAPATRRLMPAATLRWCSRCPPETVETPPCAARPSRTRSGRRRVDVGQTRAWDGEPVEVP